MSGKFSTSSKIFSYPFFFSSWTPIIQMLVHLIFSQRSLRLSSVLCMFFYLILLFRSCLHRFIFQLTDSFFCFRYSAIDSFYNIFNFSNCVFVSVCLFFNSSRSLLIDYCIFSILFSRFLIIFTIIILNSFSGSLPIFSSFIWTYVFLGCSFICAVFLCLFIYFLSYCV